MDVPIPTPIYRIIHVENLKILLERKGLYAPSEEPLDGHIYRTIHDVEVQKKRCKKVIQCGPRGCLHDYVPFYFGVHSPMLLKLHTGQVKNYGEGQEPIIYLVSHAQDFSHGEEKFVFSDGHGIHTFTNWYDDLKDLDKIDWSMIKEKIWKDNIEDNDRQRRKQAEFLIHKFCSWSHIRGIAVFNKAAENMVINIFNPYSFDLHKSVKIIKKWYY